MPVEKSCEICGAAYVVPLHREKSARTCSLKCRGELIAKRYAERRASKACAACGAAFSFPKSHEGRRTYCSMACADSNRNRNMPSGSASWNWKGGIYTHSAGYLYVSVPGHPFAVGGAEYVFEHRIVMESWMREVAPNHKFMVLVGGVPYLRPEIHVHHINGNKRDNRLKNLLACTNAAHKDIHNGVAPMDGEVYPEVEGSVPFAPRVLPRYCGVCGALFHAKASVVKRGGGLFCSRRCYNERPRSSFSIIPKQ